MCATTLVTACGPSGSGNIVTEERDVGSFDGVEVSGGIDVSLTVDPAADGSVVVVYDDNLLDNIVTEVDGTTLQVGSQGMFNVSGSGRVVEIVMPALVELAGSGGSDVTGNGEVGMLTVTASGGANVDLTDLIATIAVAEASGGADLTVNVTDEITGVASGGAELIILGDPTTQNVESSGGADIRNE